MSKRLTTSWGLGVFGLLACMAQAEEAAITDRTVLPLPEPQYPPIKALDARTVKAPPRFEVKAPKGAPNVVIVLIDDMGFGTAGTFGGPVAMPTLDRLAQGGLRYNNFHNTALCSPTRQALKTGRNHHTGNTGSIMETATAFPGDTGALPNSVAPLAEMLRLNGYSTGAFGKWHKWPRGKSASPDPTPGGPPCRVSTSSTGSSAARAINGRRRFTTG